jgi:hypothetical protein
MCSRVELIEKVYHLINSQHEALFFTPVVTHEQASYFESLFK